MNYRSFPRSGWDISEVGFGTWGMGGWTGADDDASRAALDRAVTLGCNFFDTAWAYGDGHSERLIGELLRRRPGHRLYVATKVPPKNRRWPGRSSAPARDVFPADHIVEYTHASRRNLGLDAIDLLQLHVWDDSWASDDGWKRAAEQLKTAGAIRAFGISVNRWEPENVMTALATGLVDAVQVVYNVFDQAPEDVLFRECRRRNIAVLARVPFDEGSLTGTLTPDSRWPEGDWRNRYFTPDTLAATLPRVESLRAQSAAWGITLPELALRFVLSNPAVTTVIPGMRQPRHVDSNIRVSDAGALSDAQVATLRTYRWDRRPDDCP